METKDWLSLLGVFLAPLLAIQTQKLLEKRREKRERRLNVFRILMTTRATPVSSEHVKALNMIDVEFFEEKYSKVISSWRAYHDHLSSTNTNTAVWSQRLDDLFIDLLFEMGKSLDYTFDKTILKRSSYTPVAHGNEELENQRIRQGLAKILNGEEVFPITVYANPGQNSEQNSTHE